MLDVAIATCGTALVLMVWLSVLSTTVMPRRSAPVTAKWIAVACVAVAGGFARLLPARPRAWVMALCVPVSLFAMAIGWLVGLAAGFWLLVVGFGGARPDWPHHGVAVGCTLAAAVSALLVAAAFTAYLARFLAAHSRREGMLTRAAPQVQRVTDADAVVATYLRSGSREILDGYFAEWASWLADVQASHVSIPGLVYHRSANRLGWPQAAVIVLDAAAVVEAVAPRWAPLHTRVVLDVGSRCVQCLAKQAGIVLPHMKVSLQGREEREFCDTMRLAVDSGLPAERDIEHAWRAFQEIRVRYAPYAVLLGSRLLGP